MGWKSKARIQNAVSFLPQPLAYKLYFWIQRNFGNFRKVDPLDGLKAGLETCEIIEMSGKDIRDKVILEIGTGWRVNTPIALWLLGAKKVITVDANPYIKLELIRDDLDYIRSNPGKAQDILKGRARPDRFEMLVASAGKDLSLNNLLMLFDIEYSAPMDASRTNLADGSIDFMISYNVFEHIPPPVIASILWEGNRLIRDGGLFVHRIDFSDHFAHQDKSINLANFLRYDEREWEKLVHNNFMYMNRLRVDDMENIIISSGQRVVASYPEQHPELVDLYKRGELPLSEKYRRKSEHSVCTINSWIIAEKR